MLEPDVTLTDYGLTVECLVLATLLLRRSGDAALRRRFALFFFGVAIASLAGGTVHGFFPDPESFGHRLLWPATLLAIGGSALAAWSIGCELVIGYWGPGARGAARLVNVGLGVLYGGYAAVVLLVSQEFVVAVIGYLPATVFLFGVLVWRYRHGRDREVLLGVIGLLLTFVAAGVQQGGVALHPDYFDHNALYHVIQAAALFLIWRAGRRLADQRRLRSASSRG